MALQCNAANEGAIRTTGSFINDTDWTVYLKTQFITDTPSGGDHRCIWLLGDQALGGPYVRIISEDDSNYITLNAVGVSGSGTVTTNGPLTLDRYYDIFVTYNNTTNVLEFFVDGWSIGTITSLELNGAAFAEERIGYDESANGHSNLDLEYYRSWTSILTNAQRQPERISTAAIVAAFVDTPLVSDFTDDSGSSRNWTGNGSTTFVTGVTLISTVPTNITSITAMEVFAGDTIYLNARGASSAEILWFKYTALATDMIVGALAIGESSSGYRPFTNTYLGPAAAPVAYPSPTSIGTSPNKAVQIPIGASVTEIFIRISRTSSAANPAVLKFSIYGFENQSAPAGSILVNSDAEGFPAIAVDPTTGEPLKAIVDFVAGEGGDALEFNGNILVNDLEVSNSFKLYDKNGTLVGTIALTPENAARDTIRASQQTDEFFVSLTNSEVKRLDSSGNVVATYAIPVLSGGTGAQGFDLINNILYFAGVNNASPVYTWDIALDIQGANLAAGVANYAITSILPLSTGDVLVAYFRTDIDFFVRRYNPAGAIQSTYTYGASFDQNTPRLASSGDDPISFFAWFHDDLFRSHYVRTRVSDGVTLSEGIHVDFNNGEYAGAATPTPYNNFGVQSSCPGIRLTFAMGEETPPNAASGIYQIVPNKRNDTIYITLDPETTEDVEIP